MPDQQRIHSPDAQYLKMCAQIIQNGVQKENRTGTDTISTFGHMMDFDLSNNRLPLLSTKKVFTKGIIHELIWMLSGDTNIKYLNDHGVHIWDDWADEDGELHHIYQNQWRNWIDTRIVNTSPDHLNPEQLIRELEKDGYIQIGVLEDHYEYCSVMQKKVDQIANVIKRLKTNPDCRRLLVSAWNPATQHKASLAPCHVMFQFWTRPLTEMEKIARAMDKLPYVERALSCSFYMRSNDVPLGNPFNIVQYALLTHLVAHCTDMVAEKLIYHGGDVHIYVNQLDAIKEQMMREEIAESSPRLVLAEDTPTDIFEITADHIDVEGYQSHPAIKFPPAAV